MIHEFRKPIPCVTPLGDGYVWYVTDGKMLENDCYTIILLEGGFIKHFTSDQIQIFNNETYGIKKLPSKNKGVTK